MVVSPALQIAANQLSPEEKDKLVSSSGLSAWRGLYWSGRQLVKEGAPRSCWRQPRLLWLG